MKRSDFSHGVAQLSVAERLDLISDIWASLDAENAPISQDEEVIIKNRMGTDLTEGALPWAEVEAKLRLRLV